MIPEVLWLFLHKYYRCQGQIISRKVVHRQRSYLPELDLYPVCVFQLSLRDGPSMSSSLSFIQLLIKVYRNQPVFSQQTRVSSPDTSVNQPPSNSLTYPLLNYVSATMLGIFPIDLVDDDQSRCSHLGSSHPSPTTVTRSSRHYLVCSYFVSLHQTVRSLAEELSHQFGKSLDEIRLWTRIDEVRRLIESSSG
jgi:hypothetical protein